MSIITFEVNPKAYVVDNIRAAIAQATATNKHVTFRFADVLVAVDSGSNPNLIFRDWQTAKRRNVNMFVGPRAEPSVAEINQHWEI